MSKFKQIRITFFFFFWIVTVASASPNESTVVVDGNEYCKSEKTGNLYRVINRKEKQYYREVALDEWSQLGIRFSSDPQKEFYLDYQISDRLFTDFFNKELGIYAQIYNTMVGGYIKIIRGRPNNLVDDVNYLFWREGCDQ